MPRYSRPAADPLSFTRSHDRWYSRMAGLYEVTVRLLPTWKSWLNSAIPHILGPRVLEVSFGTGYLLTQYADRFEAHGIDYNERMVEIAMANLRKSGDPSRLIRASVEALPYKDGAFDSVVNTMALSGYPDGLRAVAEMRRVLKESGRIVLIDVNYPMEGGWLGMGLANAWKLTGDKIWNMSELFDACSLDFHHAEIGGFGSVHLYVAEKRSIAPPSKPVSKGN